MDTIKNELIADVNYFELHNNIFLLALQINASLFKQLLCKPTK